MMSKVTQRIREAYSADLRDFAEFLGVKQTISRHPLATVPDNRWRQLDTAHIAAYLEHLKQTVSPKTNQPYSTATIARRITAVRELLTEATYLGLYPRQRLVYIKERLTTPPVTHDHHAGITAEEQMRLLALADSQPGLKGLKDYSLIRLWLDTGLRRAEMTGLKVKDLTVKDGIPTLMVRHGKGNKLRRIGLESYTAHVVQQWLEESGQVQIPTRPMLCHIRKTGRGKQAVYGMVNPDKHLSGEALWKQMRWYSRKAKIKSKISPHSFRVAMVTDALEGKAPLQHVQAAGGWTTTRMITEVYDRNRYAEPVAQYRKAPLPQRKGKSDRSVASVVLAPNEEAKVF